MGFRDWYRRADAAVRRRDWLIKIAFAILMFGGFALYLVGIVTESPTTDHLFGIMTLTMGLWLAYEAIFRRRFWRQVRAIRSGRCWSCGYDLRASSERCPECGAKIPTLEEVEAAEREAG